jgi:hypothetical protein
MTIQNTNDKGFNGIPDDPRFLSHFLSCFIPLVVLDSLFPEEDADWEAEGPGGLPPGCGEGAALHIPNGVDKLAMEVMTELLGCFEPAGEAGTEGILTGPEEKTAKAYPEKPEVAQALKELGVSPPVIAQILNLTREEAGVL